MSFNSILNYLKQLSILLQRESQIINIQSMKGIKIIFSYFMSFYFFLKLLRNIVMYDYNGAIFNGAGFSLLIFLSLYKNEKKINITLIIAFWFASLTYIYYLYFSDQNLDSQIQNLWIYLSIIEPISKFMCLKYQIIHKIIYHILMAKIGIKQNYDTISQILEYLIIFIMVIFNLITLTQKIIHIEKEFEKKKSYEDFQYKQPGYTYKLVKNRQDQILISKSNQFQTFQEFVDYYSKKNFVYEYAFPIPSSSLKDIIQSLIRDKNDESQSFKIVAISNKGKPDQEKFKIHIMKQQENYQNVIFLRINQIDLEEQMDQMKFKEQIFNSLNHDVKNPLIAGCFLIQNLITQQLNGHQINNDDLQQLSSYFNISLYLINGYFDFSLAQLGNLRIQTEKFLLYEPIINTIKIMQNANKKLVRVMSKFHVRNIYCKNDVRRISQVMMNLIDNAIKFSKNGAEVIVNVEEFICHNLIYVTVIDQGVGMSPEISNKIGKPFVTFNNDNVNSQGTGKGLYTSIKTVGLIGPLKYIFTSSVEGEGSQFSFFMYQNAEDIQIKSIIETFNKDINKILSYLRNNDIKIEIANDYNEFHFLEDKQMVKISQHNSKLSTNDFDHLNKSTPTKKITILVVDDDKIIRIATINALKKLGADKYQFFQAENGQIGLDKFKQFNRNKNESTIDLIITDIQMPELDGYEMVKLINDLVENSDYQKPFIIACSSNESNQYNDNCKALGIALNFTKPQSFQQFKEMILKYQDQNVNKLMNQESRTE